MSVILQTPIIYTYLFRTATKLVDQNEFDLASKIAKSFPDLEYFENDPESMFWPPKKIKKNCADLGRQIEEQIAQKKSN